MIFPVSLSFPQGLTICQVCIISGIADISVLPESNVNYKTLEKIIRPASRTKCASGDSQKFRGKTIVKNFQIP
jgi:hypothetical protein